MNRRRRTRWLWATLAVSLAMHASLLLWVRSRPAAPEPTAAATHEPIELDWVDVSPQKEERKTPEPTPPQQPQPPPPPHAQPPAFEPLPYSTAPSAGPRRKAQRDLKPGGGALGDLPFEPGRGVTVYNTGDDGGRWAALSEQGRKRVQGWVEDDLAEARALNGIVPPYFAALRRELATGIEHPPEVFSANQTPDKRLRDWAGQMVESTRGGWERYGATGSPYPEPEGFNERLDIPSQVAEAARNGSGMMSVQQRLYAGKRFIEWADGRAGVDMVVLVELKQSTDGSLREATMLKPSGVRPFDAWVMRMAEISVDAMKELPPDGGIGIHSDGMRSVWEFRGRVSYMRNVKDVDAKKDAWYMVASSIIGMQSGHFDEVSGTATYIDIRYPHYEATVRLLRLY